MNESAQNWPLYRYRARMTRAVDADTVRVECDLGMRITREVSIRIADIDGPEIFGKNAVPEGIPARDALAWLLSGKQLYIETRKDGKSFDRYVARVFVEDDAGGLVNVGDWMVNHGYAVRV